MFLPLVVGIIYGFEVLALCFIQSRINFHYLVDSSLFAPVSYTHQFHIHTGSLRHGVHKAK